MLPRRPPWLRRAVLAGGLVTCLAFLAAARADDYDERRKPGRCHCHRGQGTWDYLRSPLVPPEDPPHCGLMIGGGTCKERPRPKGVSGVCWGHQRETCFWKRFGTTRSKPSGLGTAVRRSTTLNCMNFRLSAGKEHRIPHGFQ